MIKKINKKTKANSCDGEGWVYSPEVKEHFFFPKNILFDDFCYKADGMGSVGSPACGDMMHVWIKVNKKKNVIKDIQSNQIASLFSLFIEEQMKSITS